MLSQLKTHADTMLWVEYRQTAIFLGELASVSNRGTEIVAIQFGVVFEDFIG